MRTALGRSIERINQTLQLPEEQLPHAVEGPKSMAQSILKPLIAKSTLIGVAFSNRSFSTR